MITTIYQKFISRYGETFTLVDMTDGGDYIHSEIIPAARVAKMTEEDARAEAALNWQEIDSHLDNMGM